jgi:hypothetical protein
MPPIWHGAQISQADLTSLEQAEHMAEWVKLTEDKLVLAQDAPKLSTRGREAERGSVGGPNAKQARPVVRACSVEGARGRNHSRLD